MRKHIYFDTVGFATDPDEDEDDYETEIEDWE